MFQATRRRLALWYTIVTAVLLLLFASGFYLYVRHTLVERIDDTLNHVVEIVQRSLVIEPIEPAALPSAPFPSFQVNVEASFPGHAEAVEDDHIDLEWFSPSGDLLWSTFSAPLDIPLRLSNGETVYGQIRSETERHSDLNEPAGATVNPIAIDAADSPLEQYAPSVALRQVTHQVEVNHEIVGYLRVSHPWFEVTKPSRQLIRDLSIGTALMVGGVAAIGWFLSGLAIAPVRDSYQRLKQFTADASHELRNPIAVIQTNVQVALADPDPRLQQDQLKVVERLTRRLGRLVDDLLFLARQDGGITPLKMESVPLHDLMREVVEEQQLIAKDKSLTLALHLGEAACNAQPDEKGPSCYWVQGDRNQLVRLFTNLISNAMQYTPAYGSIAVTLRRLKQQGVPLVQVQVQDTGIGIPPESLPHIFDRFYRDDPSRTTISLQGKPEATTGSGLGLAIVKVIVDNHQGHIHVESEPQQGTTFTVLLPCYRTDGHRMAD